MGASFFGGIAPARKGQLESRGRGRSGVKSVPSGVFQRLAKKMLPLRQSAGRLNSQVCRSGGAGEDEATMPSPQEVRGVMKKSIHMGVDQVGATTQLRRGKLARVSEDSPKSELAELRQLKEKLPSGPFNKWNDCLEKSHPGFQGKSQMEGTGSNKREGKKLLQLGEIVREKEGVDLSSGGRGGFHGS